MSQHVRRFLAVVVAALGTGFGTTAPAEAQSIGLGPRFAFVRGDVKADASTRYMGGLLRLRPSPRVALEVSLDYRNHLNESLTERIKDYPIQGSLLLYPVRTTISPYVLGGIGWYRQRVDQLLDDEVLESTTTSKTGYHAGLGADLWIGRHATVHADYRYTFIGRGGDEEAAPGAVPIPGLGGLQDRLQLSHKGSMWTSGVTVYF
jgi:hypothetical protein